MSNTESPHKMTAEEAREIGNLLIQFEEALKKYRSENILPKEDKKKIKRAEDEIHLLATWMFTESASLIIEESQASLEEIQKATMKARDAIKTINDVKRVIAVAAGVAKVAASVRSGDVGGVLNGIEQILEAVDG